MLLPLTVAWTRAPFAGVAWGRAPFVGIAWARAPFAGVAWARAPFVRVAWGELGENLGRTWRELVFYPMVRRFFKTA